MFPERTSFLPGIERGILYTHLQQSAVPITAFEELFISPTTKISRNVFCNGILAFLL